MDIVKDIVDKYTIEQIVEFLDSVLLGVLQNYKTAIKTNQPQVLFGDLGSIAQARGILHEMKKRNDAIEAQKQDMI